MAAYKQQVRQAPAAAAAFLGAVGLVVVEQQSWTIRVHDGVTPGGFRLPTLADLQASWAQLNSPAFTGTPVVPDIADLTTNTSQAVNAKFVQSLLPSGNDTTSVDAATTAAGNTAGLAYLNGTNGVGATLTGANNTAITIDGFVFNTLGQRLLVKDDTQVTGGAAAGSFNGVYSLTQLQAGGVPPVFTRVVNFNAPGNINYTGVIPVKSGTLNGGTKWMPTSVLAANTVGLSAIAFAELGKVAGNLTVAGTLGVTGAATLSGGVVTPVVTKGTFGPVNAPDNVTTTLFVIPVNEPDGVFNVLAYWGTSVGSWCRIVMSGTGGAVLTEQGFLYSSQIVSGQFSLTGGGGGLGPWNVAITQHNAGLPSAQNYTGRYSKV